MHISYIRLGMSASWRFRRPAPSMRPCCNSIPPTWRANARSRRRGSPRRSNVGDARSTVPAAANDGMAVEGNGAAALIGADPAGGMRVVIHRLSAPTPLAQALARERLELASAVGRAHDAGADPGLEALLAGFAAADWTPTVLGGFARALATRCDAPRLALALMRRSQVTVVADSSAATVSDEARRRLALAAGEVADAGL